MNKYHKLTENIIKHYEERKCLGYSIIDSIIREELGKMAKELTSKNWGHQTYPQFVRDILGLTDGVEVDHYAYCDSILKSNHACNCQPEKPKQEWCECKTMLSRTFEALLDDASAKYCPYCGKSTLPKEKSLVEKVVDALKCRSFCKNLIDEEVVNIAKTVIAVMEKEMGK